MFEHSKEGVRIYVSDTLNGNEQSRNNDFCLYYINY
jgi:hypothetical protein